MRFQDVPVEHLSIRVKAVRGNSLEPLFAGISSKVAVIDIKPSEIPNVFNLFTSKLVIPVTPNVLALSQQLNSTLSTGRTILSQLSNLALDGSAELDIAIFAGPLIEMGDLEIGVDDYVKKRVEELEKGRDVYSWLQETFNYEFDGNTYFFLTAGPAIEDEISGNVVDQEERDHYNQKLVKPNFANSFCVTGRRAKFVGTSTSVSIGSSSKSIYVASRLSLLMGNRDRAIRLAKGQLKFRDWTRTGQIQLLAEAQLNSLTSSESSYLRKWDEFGALEGELFLRRNRKFGALKYQNGVANLGGTFSVHLIDANEFAIEQLSIRGFEDELQFAETIPGYIEDSNLSFSEFSSDLLSRKEESLSRIEVVNFDRYNRTLTLAVENLSSAGVLVLSIAGETTQIRRRAKARKLVVEGRSANPQLGLLIEQGAIVNTLRSPQRIKPLTAFVRGKVFKNPPTLMQEKAIEIALNTPDIALIQGPPGTGKTTVIAAIVERLNELARQRAHTSKGQVLLTAFQQDAVENMIDRISLNGMPVPKFGNKGDQQENLFEKNLSNWCAEVARQLREKNPQIQEIEQESAIKDLYNQYLQSPSQKLAITLVGEIADLGGSILGEKISRQADRLYKQLKLGKQNLVDSSPHLAAIHRIRTRPGSFADDGPERANDVSVDLEDLLDANQLSLLSRAATWKTENGVPPFLIELAVLKRDLLAELTAPPIYYSEKFNDEVLTLANSAIGRLQQYGHSTTDKKSACLARFLVNLENNPTGMVSAVSQYSYAYSATVQQSVGREAQKAKSIGNGDEIFEYEYVIIDEAARVSPRDLMIAMAQGKRIILVGDHRQLPHMIDKEVEACIENDESIEDEDFWLKKSMFEYLFSQRLKELEKTDQYVRRVTLDQQFRMHPILGEFISRNFYERFDRSERFSSGLPSKEFAHHLPGTDNHPAIWIEVPTDEGQNQRLAKSWYRSSEVDAIVNQIKVWINSPQGQGLTYGIISFYKAQAEKIREELHKQLGDIANDIRKIRVGTVDSFQGMEFDVVFLSVVRTLPNNLSDRAIDRLKLARSTFGHLILSNRLNVSMSRQKKLLVVVGDSSLVTNELAKEFMPGLLNFYELVKNLGPGE